MTIGNQRGPGRGAPAEVLRIALCAATCVACANLRSAAAAAAEPIDWQTSPLDLDLRGMNGERYRFACPPGKPAAHRVAGSGPYADDSSICAAAVHAGALRARNGGDVVIEIQPGLDRYEGSERNYVKSATYERGWAGGFVVVAPPAPDRP